MKQVSIFVFKTYPQQFNFMSSEKSSYRVHSHRGHGLTWSGSRIMISGALLAVSVGFIIYVLVPFIEGFVEIQNFANLLFVILHVFYMFNVTTLKNKKQWVFWVMSYLLVDAASILFVFYDEIFI